MYTRIIFLIFLLQLNSRLLVAQSVADSLNYVVWPNDAAQAVKPVVPNLKDPYVLLAPDSSYYLTGTKTNSRGISQHEIVLYKSADLKHWKNEGVVYRFHTGAGKYATAAEIHFINHYFYIIYTQPAGGAVLLRSALAGGPYIVHAYFPAALSDASLFQDGNKNYLLYGGGMMAILSNDLTTLTSTPQPIIPSVIPPKGWGLEPVTDRIGTGGIQLLKIKGQYCLQAHDPQNRLNTMTDDVFIGVSDSSIYGPYRQRYLSVPHASHSCIFRDKTGNFYCTYSGNPADPFALFSSGTGFVPLKINALNRLMVGPSAIVEAGPVARMHPVASLKEEPFRDPSVCKGPDGNFYLVGTHGWGWQYPEKGIEIWKSPDMKNWVKTGLAWSFKDADWQKPRITAKGERKNLWAPEIRYFKGTYWIEMSMNFMVSGIVKSSTGKPEGPYTNPVGSELMDGIDGFFFPDDDGKVYLLWKRGRIAPFKEDMTGFAAPYKQLYVNDVSDMQPSLAGKYSYMLGYEGYSMIKYRGKYVLFSTDWFGDHNGSYDLMYAISDSINGPYDKKRFGIPHGGHSTVFMDGNKIYATLFGGDATAPFQMRLGIMEITFDENWNLKIVENGVAKAINAP